MQFISNFESFPDYDMDILFHVGDYASGGLSIQIQRIERDDEGHAMTNYNPLSWGTLTINLHDDSLADNEQYLDDYIEDAFCEDIEKMGYFTRTDKKKVFDGKEYTLVKWNLDKFKRAKEKEPESIYIKLYQLMQTNYFRERDYFLKSNDCVLIYTNAYRIEFFNDFLWMFYKTEIDVFPEFLSEKDAERIIEKYGDRSLAAIFAYCNECYGMQNITEQYFKDAIKSFCGDLDNKEILDEWFEREMKYPESKKIEPVFERELTRDFYSI